MHPPLRFHGEIEVLRQIWHNFGEMIFSLFPVDLLPKMEYGYKYFEEMMKQADTSKFITYIVNVIFRFLSSVYLRFHKSKAFMLLYFFLCLIPRYVVVAFLLGGGGGGLNF